MVEVEQFQDAYTYAKSQYNEDDLKLSREQIHTLLNLISKQIHLLKSEKLPTKHEEEIERKLSIQLLYN